MACSFQPTTKRTGRRFERCTSSLASTTRYTVCGLAPADFCSVESDMCLAPVLLPFLVFYYAANLGRPSPSRQVHADATTTGQSFLLLLLVAHARSARSI